MMNDKQLPRLEQTADLMAEHMPDTIAQFAFAGSSMLPGATPVDLDVLILPEAKAIAVNNQFPWWDVEDIFWRQGFGKTNDGYPGDIWLSMKKRYDDGTIVNLLICRDEDVFNRACRVQAMVEVRGLVDKAERVKLWREEFGC